MFCENCGKALPQYAVFCPACGVRVPEKETPTWHGGPVLDGEGSGESAQASYGFSETAFQRGAFDSIDAGAPSFGGQMAAPNELSSASGGQDRQAQISAGAEKDLTIPLLAVAAAALAILIPVLCRILLF